MQRVSNRPLEGAPGFNDAGLRVMLLHPDGRPVAPGVGGTFWMVLAGHARLTAAQGQFRVQAGEWIALTATQANEVLVEPHGVVLGVTVPPRLQAEWLADPLAPAFFLARGTTREFDRQRALQLLDLAMQIGGAGTGCRVSGATPLVEAWQRLISSLQIGCRDVSSTCPGYSALRRRQVFMRFQHALLMLQGRTDRIVRITELAHACNFSPCYFSRVFQLLYGDTPQRIAARHRLERAHALIVATGIPIIDVAAECGFENPSSFARAFRAQYGISASTIRITASKKRTAIGLQSPSRWQDVGMFGALAGANSPALR